jgi:hypothetical protein
MKLVSKQNILPTLKTVGILLIGSLITFLFQEPIKRWLYESSPRLEYQVLSSQKLDKFELLQLLHSNFKRTTFRFPMDDDIISEYHYTILELRNKGNFIRDDLFFDLDFNNQEIKILAVLCKTITPEEREIKAETERPPLDFQLSKQDLESPAPTVYWNPDSIEMGAVIYRSYSKHAGFGRRNPTLNIDGSFSEKLRNGFSYYYAVTNQDSLGQESELTQIIYAPMPEFFFNKASFKETINVRIRNPSRQPDPNILLSEFNNAKAKLKGKLKIFANIDRRDFTRIVSQKIDNLPIYFTDDVKFLYGRTTLRLNNITRKAKIRFYIISKTYLDYDNYNLTLALRDMKDIELTKVHADLKGIPKKDKVVPSKDLLTPYQVRLFALNDRIIITWAQPKTETYAGVRIFRSPFSISNTDVPWGKELYDGKGTQGIVVNSGILTGIRTKQSATVNPYPRDPMEPPPPKNYLDTLRPQTPRNLQIQVDVILNGCNGELMPFYEDHVVPPGETYVYTVVAYDNRMEYSYPVESIIAYDSKTILPNLRSYSEYQTNLKLLRLLRQFYHYYNNKAKEKQLQSAISLIERNLPQRTR